MRTSSVAAALLPVGLVTASCAPPGAGAPREIRAAAPPAVGELVEGNAAFALDLYARLGAQPTANILIAPQSISTALAMTYAGARTETAEQMARTMHFGLEPQRLHPAFGALEAATTADPQLVTANHLWAQAGEPLLPSFLATVERGYAGGFETLDFRRDPERARHVVNAWISDRTAARIPELFGPGQIDSATALVLANAVHFDGAWRTRFDPQRTETAEFRTAAGGTTAVPLMHLSARLEYAEHDLLHVVGLPFTGDRLELVILLPKSDDGLAAVEAAMADGGLPAWLASRRPRSVRLALPRFSSRSRFELSEDLAAMGMPLAFTAQADFSGMNGRSRDLFISLVVHETFIEVDEEGAEAAAATGVTMQRGGRPRSVRADHPFVYLIRDRLTGSIVFLGRLADPGVPVGG